jgi:glucose-6-phosphate 1-dehydrogenase
VQPALEKPPQVKVYEPGSWGPEEAERIKSGYGGWHDPSSNGV